MGFFSRHNSIERERIKQRDEKLNNLAMRESIKQSRDKLERLKLQNNEVDLRREVKEKKRELFRKKYIEPIQRASQKVKTIKKEFKPKKSKSVFDTGRNPFE